MRIPEMTKLSGEQLKAWKLESIRQMPDGTILYPIEAKAFYTLGIMIQSIKSAKKLLTHSDGGLYADFMVPAIFMTCTAIEVLGYCLGKTSMGEALKVGFTKFIDNQPLVVNVSSEESYTYTIDDLIRLRNFGGHGQKKIGQDSTPAIRELRLHIELLDSFPIRLKRILDTYYDDVRTKIDSQVLLAKTEIYPHYLDAELQNHLFMPPHIFSYNLMNIHKTPSEVIEADEFGEWNIYKAIIKRTAAIDRGQA